MRNASFRKEWRGERGLKESIKLALMGNERSTLASQGIFSFIVSV